MLFRFSLYGFLKNQRYFEPFFMLALLSHNVSFFTIGLLYAFRLLTINLLEIPSGIFADGHGRRVTMIVSLVAYVLSFALFGLATNVPLLFLAMFLFGIGDALRTGTHKAMIFEWLKLCGEEDDAARVYGLTRSWSKIGSAVSSVLAAICVILTDDYQSVFFFAAIPYVANIINLIGYPAELDGLVYREPVWDTVRSLGKRFKQTMQDAWQRASLRQLFVESMAWEGVYAATKDFIQPALLVVATAQLMGVYVESPEITASQNGVSRGAVIAIAAVYVLLFLGSSIASRFAHQLPKRLGGERAAVRTLWIVSTILFAAMLLFDLVGFALPVVAVFVLLALAQNLWRPLLIARIDAQADSARKATVLSLESQSQRLAALALSPIVGALVDLTTRGILPGSFWPIAAAGVLASAGVLLAFYRTASSARLAVESSTVAEAEASEPDVAPD